MTTRIPYQADLMTHFVQEGVYFPHNVQGECKLRQKCVCTT
jgi:hypothetical protein